MPKRFRTPDPQIFMYADGSLYLRIGNRERSLGTKDFDTAVKRKLVAHGKLDQTGEASGRLKCGDVWPDYQEYRKSLVGKPEGQIVSNVARRKQKSNSPETYREIEGLWRRHLGPFFKNVRVDRLHEEDLWVEFVEQVDLIDAANARKVWRGFLKNCKAKKYIKYIPDMPIPSVERRERRVLRPHEIRKIFQHARGSTFLFISMYLFMGMRRKEIMTLRWSSVHLTEGYLILRKSDVKTRKGRSLPINEFVGKLLIQRKDAQISKRKKTDFVFPHRETPSKHADVSGLKTAWGRVVRECGFEPGYVTPHDLRATYEAYAHKSKDFTDTQREKFAGASIDVQKKTYVRFDADDVRGLESVVQVPGLQEILMNKLQRGNNGDLKKHEALH